MIELDLVAAAARAEFFADTVGVEAPETLLTSERYPSPELLDFCLNTGASLDWIFLGDVRGMIRASYELSQRRR